MTFRGGEVDGTVAAPPSKSRTHRAVLLAAMADGTSSIARPLDCADTRATVRAAAAMGADVKCNGTKMEVRGGRLHPPDGALDAGNSGTALRLLAGVASIFDEEVTITGDRSLRSRPMSPLLDSLRGLGVRCASDGGRAPVVIRGPGRGGRAEVDGSMSSQFVSALMLPAPMREEGTSISIKGRPASRQYIRMTSEMMGLFGADVSAEGGEVRVEGGTGYRPRRCSIPGDVSSAAFPLVAGALGGRATVEGVDASPEGDGAIFKILRDAGADVSVGGGRATCRRGRLRGLDVDIGDAPDLFPALAVLFSTAEGRTAIRGAPQLRFKESDRIASVAGMLSALGADVSPTEDGCTMRGVERLKGGRVDACGDHRVMMAAAVASVVCESPVEIAGAECFAASYPDFPEHMRRLGLEARRCTRWAAG